MQSAALTITSLKARPVVLKLERPIIARIATITDWPLILMDLTTSEGIVGRSYLGRPSRSGKTFTGRATCIWRCRRRPATW